MLFGKKEPHPIIAKDLVMHTTVSLFTKKIHNLEKKYLINYQSVIHEQKILRIPIMIQEVPGPQQIALLRLGMLHRVSFMF